MLGVLNIEHISGMAASRSVLAVATAAMLLATSSAFAPIGGAGVTALGGGVGRQALKGALAAQKQQLAFQRGSRRAVRAGRAPGISRLAALEFASPELVSSERPPSMLSALIL